MKNRIMFIGFVVLFAGMAGAGPTYSGTLNAGANGGLTGFNDWNSDDTILSWTVEQVGWNWSYTYTFSVPTKNISHFILEVSPSFTSSNILSSNHTLLIDTYGEPGEPGNSNPNIPGEMKGIKTGDTIGALSYSITFTSNRMPVWGDFYATDGKNDPIPYVYNTGYSAIDPGVSYTTLYTDQSVFGHILRPDSLVIVPAPGAVLLAGLGTGLVGWMRRRNSI